jgi:hypothetical protein
MGRDVEYSLCLPFAAGMKVRVLIRGYDREVFLNRGDRLADVNIQIWRGAVFGKKEEIFRMFPEVEEKLWVKAYYREEFSKCLVFNMDSLMTSSSEMEFYSAPLSEHDYMTMMGFSMVDRKKVSRFFPTKWELSNIKDVYFNCKGRIWSKEDVVQVGKVRDAMSDLKEIASGMEIEKVESNLDAFTSFSAGIKMRDSITLKEMKVFMKNRHDYFMRLFLVANDLDDKGTSDVNMSTSVGIDVLIRKTPDYYFKKEETHFFIEFAVTEADTFNIMDGKMSTYSKSIEIIRNELYKAGRNEPVELIIVVLDYKTHEVLISNEELEFSTDLDVSRKTILAPLQLAETNRKARRKAF